MVIKGRSRSNGAQLANYLLNNRANDNARILDVRGTAQPDNLKSSLLEMSFSSRLSKRGANGLYHAQINPAIGEDRPMTSEDWLRAAEVLEQSLGLDGQKRAIVLHEKNGRLHGHVVWERYDHHTGKLRTDGKNYKKHDQARAQIEEELGHDLTPQKAAREPTDKERLSDLWREHSEGSDFVEAAAEAGYQVVQGFARRPFRVLTPDGQSLDLTRQLDGTKAKAVRDRLQPIREELPTEADALQRQKAERDRASEQNQPEPERSEYQEELSAQPEPAQTVTVDRQPTDRPAQEHAPTPANDNAPPLPLGPEPEKTGSDISLEQSDFTDKAAAILEEFRRQKSEREKRQKLMQEARQSFRDISDSDEPNPRKNRGLDLDL